VGKRQVSFSRKLLYLSVSAIATLVLCEFAIRMMEDKMRESGGIEISSNIRIPSIARHHAFNPLKEEMRESWGDRRVRYAINSMGMRDEEAVELPLKDESKYRIVFFGDSFTEGTTKTFLCPAWKKS
jgi:hypothetical protein